MTSVLKSKRKLTIEIPEGLVLGSPQSPANLRMAEITPSLYISSYKAVRDLCSLRSQGITHIVNASGYKNLYEDTFTYCSLTMPDNTSTDIRQHLTTAVAFIESSIVQGGKVLVHCYRGKSRAPTIACAYLVLKDKLSVGRAMKRIKQQQPHISLNFGFLAQLSLLE